MSDKISIVVPVYNVADEVTRCVHSILKQTYANLEIVLVDDGSIDGSREIIEELALADSRIVPIYKENGGVTSARLAGIRAATGDWLGFVDGDDEIEPWMYEFLLENAKRYHADISHCGYQMVFSDGRIHYFYNTGRLAEQDRLTGLNDLLTGSFIEPGLWNKLYHNTLFHSLLHKNVMDTSIQINEDLLMNFHLFSAAKKSIYEDKCPYHYMVRQNSTSRQKLSPKKLYDPIRVKEQIMKLADDDLRSVSETAYLSTCISCYNSIVVDDSFNSFDNELKDIRERIIKERKIAKKLGIRGRVLYRLIASFPICHRFLYCFYEKHFQKKKYD